MMRRETAAAFDLGDDHQRLSHAVRELGPYLATAYILAILLVGIVEIAQAGGLTPGAVTGSFSCARSSWCPDDRQFVICRQVLSRIKRALEEKGIRFARRQVQVHVAQPSRAPDALPATKPMDASRPGRRGSVWRIRRARVPASGLRTRRGSRQPAILRLPPDRSSARRRSIAMDPMPLFPRRQSFARADVTLERHPGRPDAAS
jgi:hypothetical protein